MKALDTNVLVRFLVRDDKKQAEIVYRLFKRAESKNEPFFVPSLVVLETIWVLESVYEISREEIRASLQKLLLMPILIFEAQSALQRTLSSAQTNKIDLADLLIAHSAKFSNCDGVLTFDKKASKFALFEQLT
ncbi:MAG: type II toxin-antitoxin system VapC family toxin [Gemmatimonadetes bacterium]|nr:type II toxin-antitoxin system VapC family toxin [Gemmatimonadota bacterium]MDE2741844.1 type II toxin-antitoxin system VapC family toxin [Gemmatimonadota bacterium]